MLILTRKKDESIVIGDGIKIQIIAIEEGRVKIGIDAPSDVEIYRSEVLEKIEAENKAAAVHKQGVKVLSEKMKHLKG